MNTSPPPVDEEEMTNKTKQLKIDDLRRALCDADAAIPRSVPSLTADDLLAGARQRRVQAVKTRSTIVAIAVVAVTLILVRTSGSPDSAIEQRAGSVSARSDLRAEIAALEREAAIHQQVARQLIRDRRLAELEAAAGPAPAVASLLAAQEASRSAAISLQYATIVEQESPDPQRAKQEYERVTRRFPGTPWAALAAASVERLSTHNLRPKL
jgi:hypothetical protein